MKYSLNIFSKIAYSRGLCKTLLYYPSMGEIIKTNPCRKGLSLIVLIICSITGFASFADEAGKPGTSFAFSELGQKASEKADSASLGIRAVDNGAEIVCELQALEASVTPSGISIKSTSSTEGGGIFSMKVAGLGRIGHRLSQFPENASVSVSNNIAQVIRPDFVEEYTVSGDGIRQDFIVSKKPEGNASLSLAIGLSGATAELSASGLKIRLIETGREFAYSRLLVTDAAGKTLPAEFKINSQDEFVVSVDDSNAIYPIRIDPTISDNNWIGMDGIAGVNGVVYVLTCDSFGNLYVGGAFTTAGGVTANHIAKWDGSAWSALGSGMNDSVFALTCDSSGNLYAGGYFTTAGGVSANYIAKWDGSSWSALGSGMDHYVLALAVDASGTLYAGGWFSAAGGATVYNIAKWNGSAWSTLGWGFDAGVLTLAVDTSGNLYAGGFFVYSGKGHVTGGITFNGIAKWDGSSWIPLGWGLNDGVTGIALDSTGNLYAGGRFTFAAGVWANHIAKWEGSSWSALGSGTSGMDVQNILALSVDSSGNLYTGGRFSGAGGKVSAYLAKCVIPAILTMAVSGNGTISPSVGSSSVNKKTAIPISATAQSGYHFVNWTKTGNAVIDDVNISSTSVVLSADATVTANFARDTATLTISHIGSGNATLSDGSNAKNINTLSATTIKAIPAADWHFVDWTLISGSANITNTKLASTTATLIGDHGSAVEIQAQFLHNQAALTMATNGHGSTTPDIGTSNIDTKTLTSISASPDTGYHFVNWTKSGGATITDPLLDNTTVSLTSASTVTANFAINTKTATFGHGDNGTVSGVSPQTVNYGSDTADEITAIPADNYHFVNWTGTGGFESTDNPLIVKNVTQDMTITANFARNTETLTVNKVGLGTLTGSGTFDTQTTNHTITATPDADYAFINWTISGDGTIADADSATTDVTLTSPRHGTTFTATANFFNETTNTLNSGDSTPLLSDSKGGTKVYKINVPDSNQKYLTATLTGVTAPDDCDLYARFGKIPSLQTYAYRSTNVAGNNDTITIQYPSAGDWYFMIYAYDGYSDVTFSASYGTDLPDKPTNLEATISGDRTQVNLTWDAVAGADSYNLYRSKINSLENAVKLNSDPILDLTYADPFAGTYYYYFVTAVDGGKESGSSDPAKADPAQDTITKTLINEVVLTGIGGSVGETKTYSINIPNDLQTLLEIKISGGTGDCDFAVIDPDGKIVKRKTGMSNNETVQISGNPLVDGDWLIRLYGVTEYSGLTLVAKYSMQTATPPAPTSVKASDGLFDDKILVTWTATPGATGYKVGRKNSLADTDFAEEFETANNIFEDSSKAVLDAEPGTPFFYFVKAKNSVDYGKYSTGDSGYRMKDPLVPKAPKASDGTYFDKIQVTWKKVANATSYIVYRTESPTAVPDPDTDRIGETTALFYDDMGDKILPPVDGGVLVLKKYYYWIAAKNKSGTSAVSKCNDGYISKKGPATVSATNGTYSNKITVTWSAVPGATAYDVYRYDDKNLSIHKAKVGNAVTTTFCDDTVIQDMPFYYCVKAKYGVKYDSDPSRTAIGLALASGMLPPVPVSLTDNVSKSIPDNDPGSWTYYSIDVPMGTTRLVATLTGTGTDKNNDCDLFARFAYFPSTKSYGAKGVESITGNTETITISNPATGTWHFLLYGYTAYTNVTLTVKCYKVADIVLASIPSNDLAVPFTATFTGQVVDGDGKGIPNIILQVRNPITGQTSFLKKTDKNGLFMYSALVNSEGEHTFDFFFNDMPDTAKGTASHTVAARKGCIADSYFDISCYLPAKPVPLTDHAVIMGLQHLLDTRNGWDEDDIDVDYAKKWVENTLVSA